jgi:hypothetical protein
VVKFEIPDEFVPVTIRALENYSAYMKATNRDDGLPTRALEFFQTAERKGPAKEEGQPAVKKKKA